MNRIKSTFKLIPKWNVFGLAAFSLLVTWLSTYQHMIEYLEAQGENIEVVGRTNVLWVTLDGTVIIFSLLVLVAAGILPIISVLIKPTPTIAKVAQIVWVVLIVGLLYIAKATS